jgi:hypothetical protein
MDLHNKWHGLLSISSVELAPRLLHVNCRLVKEHPCVNTCVSLLAHFMCVFFLLSPTRSGFSEMCTHYTHSWISRNSSKRGLASAQQVLIVTANSSLTPAVCASTRLTIDHPWTEINPHWQQAAYIASCFLTLKTLKPEIKGDCAFTNNKLGNVRITWQYWRFLHNLAFNA